MNLYADSDRNIIGDDSSPTLTLENSSTGSVLNLKSSAVSAPTIATLSVTNSVASGAFFEFKGFLASVASASSLARGIRVKFGDEYGFIPIYKGGVYV